MHKIGAIPFDINGNEIAILFITSQTRGRWIFPKGTLENGENHHGAVKREAYEEAGIKGDVLDNFPITIPITKKTSNGVIKVPVTYYPLFVREQLEEWPEQESRQRHWSLLRDASKATDRADFLHLINQFEQLSPWMLEISKGKTKMPQATPTQEQ